MNVFHTFSYSNITPEHFVTFENLSFCASLITEGTLSYLIHVAPRICYFLFDLI